MMNLLILVQESNFSTIDWDCGLGEKEKAFIFRYYEWAISFKRAKILVLLMITQ